MSLDEGVSDLIKSIYCAGEDSCAWDAITDRLLKLIGARWGLTAVVDLKNREFSTYRYFGPNTSAAAQGVEEYSELYVADPSRNFCENLDDAPVGTDASVRGPKRTRLTPLKSFAPSGS